jgi:NAD(P)-dependent dehydrogenase (short-subunit alcohol dehydrogenase family)
VHADVDHEDSPRSLAQHLKARRFDCLTGSIGARRFRRWKISSGVSLHREWAMGRREDGEDRVNTPSLCGRRRFLSGAATLTAGMSLAGMLPTIREASATPAAGVRPESCADVNFPMRDVQGKVAFITGGSSGIGLGIARAFVGAGMKVILGYRTKEHIEEAMELFDNMKARVHGVSVDVTNRPGMEKAAAEAVQVFGKIHVLVNNAGVLIQAALLETTYDDWDWVMNVNVNGVFNGVRAFLPHLLAHGEGSQIVATASMDGIVAEPWHNPSYTASKYAVVGMMESLRATLAEQGIGVSVYCPGAVRTRIGDSDRNRPNRPKIAENNKSSEAEDSSEESKLESQIYMDPLKAGELVLEGMRNNSLYIFTHREYEPLVRDRNEALVAAFRENSTPTEMQVKRLRHWRESSIYRNERDRAACNHPKRTQVAK